MLLWYSKKSLQQFTWIFLIVIYAISVAIKQEASTPGPDAVKKGYNWSVIADSVQTAFYQDFLSDNGHYIAQDNAGNQSFHYWWNAHVLDVLVDAHLRKGDQGEKMLNILHGIKRQNKGHYPNDYYDDMEWQKANLVDPGTGMVWDGINRNGDQKIDKNWLFTYNQGVHIGAAVELFLITKDTNYLEDAIQTANFVINSLELAPKGILKKEGSGDGGLSKEYWSDTLPIWSRAHHRQRIAKMLI